MKSRAKQRLMQFLSRSDLSEDLLDSAFTGGGRSLGGAAGSILEALPIRDTDELLNIPGIGKHRLAYMLEVAGASNFDKFLVAQPVSIKPDWVLAAEAVGLDTYRSLFGWVVDVNSQPERAARYLAENAVNVFDEFFMAEDFALLRAARDLRRDLERSHFRLPSLDQRRNPEVPTIPELDRDLRRSFTRGPLTFTQGNLSQGFRAAIVERGYTEADELTQAGIDYAVGDSADSALFFNSMFISTVFFAPDGNRQYLFFGPGGPEILFDTGVNSAALRDLDLDETETEIVELVIELVAITVSILGLAIGIGAAKAAFGALEGLEAQATKEAFRKVALQLLKNQRLKKAIRTLLIALAGIDLNELRKGNKEVVTQALTQFGELIYAIWDEGEIKTLLTLLGAEAVVIGSIVFILWFFGVGEVISVVLVALGVGFLIKDIVVFIAKLLDTEKRQATTPQAAPVPAGGG